MQRKEINFYFNVNNLIDNRKQKKIIEKIIKGRQDPIGWINKNIYINVTVNKNP